MKYNDAFNIHDMDDLDEEEQLRHIYSPKFGSRPNSTDPTKPDETISQSSTILYEIEDVALKRQWQQIKFYVCFKAIIWLFIGTIIFVQNSSKQDLLTASADDGTTPWDTAQKWCCECHMFASNMFTQKTFPRRIDWSYCANCFNCTACLLTPSQKLFNNETCEGMTGMHHSNAEEDCHLPKHILSDTTMKLFSKNYHAYGWGALITCLLYVGITMMVFVVEETKHHVDTIGMLLMVYNIVVAMVCFYMIYKPNQYQKKFITSYLEYDTENEEPYCYVDTLGSKMEDALSGFIFGSLMLMFLQWLFCCCKCAIKRRRKENLNCLTSVSERIYISVTLLCGIGFFITMFTAVGYLIYYLYNHSNKLFTLQIIWLFIIDILLILSCIDIFCCPFCRKRANDCCEARNIRLKYQKKKYKNQLHKETLLTAQQDLEDVDDDRF